MPISSAPTPILAARWRDRKSNRATFSVTVTRATNLLGAVIEEVSGQFYHDFFAVRVFDRLKMKNTFSVPDRRIHGPHCATGYTLDERGDLLEAGASGLD